MSLLSSTIKLMSYVCFIKVRRLIVHHKVAMDSMMIEGNKLDGDEEVVVRPAEGVVHTDRWAAQN